MTTERFTLLVDGVQRETLLAGIHLLLDTGAALHPTIASELAVLLDADQHTLEPVVVNDITPLHVIRTGTDDERVLSIIHEVVSGVSFDSLIIEHDFDELDAVYVMLGIEDEFQLAIEIDDDLGQRVMDRMKGGKGTYELFRYLHLGRLPP